MAGELEPPADEAEGQREQEEGKRHEGDVDREEQDPQDRGGDADHVEDEARGVRVPRDPVADERMGREGRIDHLWGSLRRAVAAVNLTVVSERVSLANFIPRYHPACRGQGSTRPQRDGPST